MQDFVCEPPFVLWDSPVDRNTILFDIIDKKVCKPQNRGKIGKFGQGGTITQGSWLVLRDSLRPLLLGPFSFVDVGAADGRMVFVLGAHAHCVSSQGIEIDCGVLGSRREGSMIPGGGGRKPLFDASVRQFGVEMQAKGVEFNPRLVDVMYDTNVSSLVGEAFPVPLGVVDAHVPKIVYMFNDGWAEEDRDAASAMCAKDADVRVVVTTLPGCGRLASYVPVEIERLQHRFEFVQSVAVTMSGSGEGKTMCLFKRK